MIAKLTSNLKWLRVDNLVPLTDYKIKKDDLDKYVSEEFYERPMPLYISTSTLADLRVIIDDCHNEYLNQYEKKNLIRVISINKQNRTKADKIEDYVVDKIVNGLALQVYVKPDLPRHKYFAK